MIAEIDPMTIGTLPLGISTCSPGEINRYRSFNRQQSELANPMMRNNHGETLSAVNFNKTEENGLINV
jgi:hypothetical protein